jgi:hypothetical protein
LLLAHPVHEDICGESHAQDTNGSKLLTAGVSGIGGVSVKTAAEYRAMAQECIRWADDAYTDEVRESYLQLAQIWLNTASRLDVLFEALSKAPISAAADEQKKAG